MVSRATFSTAQMTKRGRRRGRLECALSVLLQHRLPKHHSYTLLARCERHVDYPALLGAHGSHVSCCSSTSVWLYQAKSTGTRGQIRVHHGHKPLLTRLQSRCQQGLYMHHAPHSPQLLPISQSRSLPQAHPNVRWCRTNYQTCRASAVRGM